VPWLHWKFKQGSVETKTKRRRIKNYPWPQRN
jgi:hypothetical protein